MSHSAPCVATRRVLSVGKSANFRADRTGRVPTPSQFRGLLFAVKWEARAPFKARFYVRFPFLVRTTLARRVRAAFAWSAQSSGRTSLFEPTSRAARTDSKCRRFVREARPERFRAAKLCAAPRYSPRPCGGHAGIFRQRKRPHRRRNPRLSGHHWALANPRIEGKSGDFFARRCAAIGRTVRVRLFIGVFAGFPCRSRDALDAAR